MNPKSMTPVAFWVVNRNTDFSGGDYVDWHEVETRFGTENAGRSATRTPPLNLAISARSSKNNPPGIRPGKPAALRRVPLYSSIPHSHGRRRPISLRYKNAR